MWDVGYGMCPGWSSELTASPAWGAHEGHWGVGPPGAAELEPPACGILKNPPFGAKAGAWHTGSQTAALACIPEAGKDLTPNGQESLPCAVVSAGGMSSAGQGGQRGNQAFPCGAALLAPCVPRSVLLLGKGLDPRSWGAEMAGILAGPGAVGHSCAAGRAGLPPSPSSLGIGWCGAFVLEVFTRV